MATPHSARARLLFVHARARDLVASLCFPQESIATNFGDCGAGSTASSLQGATTVSASHLRAYRGRRVVSYACALFQRERQRLHSSIPQFISLVAEVSSLLVRPSYLNNVAVHGRNSTPTLIVGAAFAIKLLMV